MVDTIEQLPAAARRLLGQTAGFEQDIHPPFHLHAVNFFFVGAIFDRAAARAAVPAQLELADDSSGVVALYSAPTGWGLAPYTGFFYAVAVKGHDSADGSLALFMAQGFYSGRAGSVLPKLYNNRLSRGFSRQWQTGADYHGEAGAPGELWVSMSVRESAPALPAMAGIHRYIGEVDGRLSTYSIAYSAGFDPVEVTRFETGPDASLLARSLKPLSFHWGFLCPVVSLTISEPAPLTKTPVSVSLDDVRLSLLDLLARLGKPAALLNRQGRIIFINDDAEQLLAGAIRSGGIAASHRREQHELDRAIVQAIERGPSALADPVALSQPDRPHAILAQAIPVSAILAGEPAALVLFSDPTAETRSDPTAALRLLGLTPAEARIAASVGNGSTVRDAALSLLLTENTVRSTLRTIYDKLSIGKQSELARIVTRLDGLGRPLLSS